MKHTAYNLHTKHDRERIKTDKYIAVCCSIMSR